MDRLRCLLALLFFPLFACASAGEPGTGDISFRVTWAGEADVDLYVRSPLGESINYGVRHSDSGGLLDVDCNFQADDSVRYRGDGMCTEPMENIYWPGGNAPAGVYEYWLLLPNPEGVDPADTYMLEVRFGRETIWSLENLVSSLESDVPVFQVSYPEGSVARIEPEE